MAEEKTFIYQYDDDPENEDEVLDLIGELDLPRIGDLLYRRKKVWKVTSVLVGVGSQSSQYRVRLSDVSKSHLIN